MRDWTSCSLAQRLQHAITVMNITKKELALMVGVSPASISGWMGQKRPSLDKLLKIATQLNISLDWLITGNGPLLLNGPLRLTGTEHRLVEQTRRMPAGTLQHFCRFLGELLEVDRDSLLSTPINSMILDKADIAIAVVDSRGVIVDVNEKALALGKYSPAEKHKVVGRPATAWLTSAERDRIGKITADGEANLATGMRVSIHASDGSSVPAIVSHSVNHCRGHDWSLVTIFPLALPSRPRRDAAEGMAAAG